MIYDSAFEDKNSPVETQTLTLEKNKYDKNPRNGTKDTTWNVTTSYHAIIHGHFHLETHAGKGYRKIRDLQISS
jgi:hypothetical protein